MTPEEMPPGSFEPLIIKAFRVTPEALAAAERAGVAGVIPGSGTINGIPLSEFVATDKRPPSNHPVDIFCDLAGIPRDDPKYAKIREYCDQLVPDGRGGLEPRFGGSTNFPPAPAAAEPSPDKPAAGAPGTA